MKVALMYAVAKALFLKVEASGEWSSLREKEKESIIME